MASFQVKTSGLHISKSITNRNGTFDLINLDTFDLKDALLT